MVLCLSILFIEFLVLGIKMASASSSKSQPHFKTDPHSPIWKYVEMVQQLLGGGGFTWICSHCKARYNNSYSQAKTHLCFIPHQVIKVCPGTPKGKGLLAKKHVLAYIEEKAKANKATEKIVTMAHPLEKTKKGSKASPSPFVLGPIKDHPFFYVPQKQPITHTRAKRALETTFTMRVERFLSKI